MTVDGALRSDLIDEVTLTRNLEQPRYFAGCSSASVAGTIFGGVLALLCLLFLLWPDPVWPGVEEETDEAGDLPVSAAVSPLAGPGCAHGPAR